VRWPRCSSCARRGAPAQSSAVPQHTGGVRAFFFSSWCPFFAARSRILICPSVVTVGATIKRAPVPAIAADARRSARCAHADRPAARERLAWRSEPPKRLRRATFFVPYIRASFYYGHIARHRAHWCRQTWAERRRLRLPLCRASRSHVAQEGAAARRSSLPRCRDHPLQGCTLFVISSCERSEWR
jgi:hypothetical protein